MDKNTKNNNDNKIDTSVDTSVDTSIDTLIDTLIDTSIDNKIDTLVISGASTKMVTFIGIFRALYEKGIISKDLNGIKHISCVSVGYFYSIILALRISEKFSYECVLKTDFINLLDIDNISIDSLIYDMGFINHHMISKPIEIILKEKFKKDNLTLKELFNKTKIKITVKCVNVTKSETYFINHETDPDLEVCKLLLMTTAIPIFFKPILYNGCYYIDGGISGNLPIESIDPNKDNYIGIYISSNKNIDFKKEEYPILSFLNKMLTVSSKNLDPYLDKCIILEMNESSTNFELTNEQKEKMIDFGYYETLKQLRTKFNLS